MIFGKAWLHWLTNLNISLGQTDMSAGSSANNSVGHGRFSVQHGRASPVSAVEPGSSPVTLRKRKGASTVGLGLSDMNQQFCSTMMGITFGSSAACQVLLILLYI